MNAKPAFSDLRQALASKRNDAITAFRLQPVSDRLLNDLRRATDEALRGLLRIHPLPKGATLAAVGGYGRGELYPFSDVDLLILLAQPASEKDQAMLSELVAALWDLGIEPGYSVRTLEECLVEADADITVQTSLLESRFIAGRRSLFNQFNQTLTATLDAQAFFQAKLAEMQQRHARYQDTPYSLEPTCKESPGGLRDLQVIRWMAKAAGFGSNWTQISRSGLLTSHEARDLKRAELAFKRLRIEMHLLAGQKSPLRRVYVPP
jgi:[protein-PII] uridylyltransferase